MHLDDFVGVRSTHGKLKLGKEEGAEGGGEQEYY